MTKKKCMEECVKIKCTYCAIGYNRIEYPWILLPAGSSASNVPWIARNRSV